MKRVRHFMLLLFVTFVVYQGWSVQQAKFQSVLFFPSQELVEEKEESFLLLEKFCFVV
ncbi:unnamed protein product [Cylicocyclus nassatus]|uniref:Uncharacterized protein n=1 Tax=Cylicocyclus nassatus TaxID=53992 RepID=A0AA36H1P8_CYLNA|nr:unnamed protein product [Cylicocyclus nassatus]